MPNQQNILSPLTIVGNGRSGTSLVSRVVGDHPHVQFAGETANLIHSVWKSLESSLIPKKQPEIPLVIRNHFLQLFPGESPRWLHKPIGVPIVWSLFASEDEFCDWYWRVLPAVFPEARYFTVLRHPMDVILSSHSWWGWSVESIINSNRIMARLLTHKESRVDFAVSYHELISKPKPQVKRLLEYLQLDFDKSCMKPFETGHVVTGHVVAGDVVAGDVVAGDVVGQPDLKKRRESSFSHRDRWNEVDATLLTRDFRDAVDECWKKYGFDFGGWEV